MLTKIEISGVVIGIVAVLFQLTVLFSHQYLPLYFLDFFRGDHIGGVVVGVALLFGFISIILFIINMVFGNRSKWFIRLGLMAIFTIGSAYVGSYV